jgi:hypothetical protein
MLDMKAAAIEKQIFVPGLSKLIEMYLQWVAIQWLLVSSSYSPSRTVAQSEQLREQGWWKRFRKLRDWHGSGDEFKERCQTVYNLAHVWTYFISKYTFQRWCYYCQQTSFMVHAHMDKSETIPGGKLLWQFLLFSSNIICRIYSTTQISRRPSPTWTQLGSYSTPKSIWRYSNEIYTSRCWTSRTKLE